MNFNFGEVLSRAWQIITKHKVLWIFGMLASCSQGGSRFNSGSNGGGRGGNGNVDIPPALQRVFEYIAQNAVTFIAIIITVACLLSLITIFLGTIGRIGVIRGTWQAETGAQHLIFGQLFSESTPYFWRLFGLSLLVSLPFVIVFGGLAAALIVFGISMSQGNDASAIGLAGTIPVLLGCLCLFVPFAIVINMVVRQAERAIVLENARVLPALSRGWEVFTRNLGVLLVMAILLFVIGLVAGFIFAIPVLLVVIPAVIAFVVGNAESWTPLIVAGALLCIYIPIAWLLNGILTSYTESVWTLTYMRLTGTPGVDALTPEPVIPPSLDEGDKTVISSPNA